jgi:2-keto-4-pentenoate hydratase
MAVDLHELAQRMLADYDVRTPGRSFVEPLDLTTPQAYALQAEVARLRERRGEKVVGYKVGCTSSPIREQLGIKEPIFGRLYDTECYPFGVHLSSSRFANLAVEGELAVRLSMDLPSKPLSPEDCREAISEVFPVIELHHFVLPGALESLRCLAGRLAQLELQLCKGQVILTGSPMKLYPVSAGSRIVVEAPPLGASCVEIDP